MLIDNFWGNIAPTGLSISNSKIAEHQPVGTVIGKITTTDPNGGSRFTYSIEKERVGPHPFVIVGDELRANKIFDFDETALNSSLDKLKAELLNSYRIYVKTTDPGGLSAENVFLIQITDINETPKSITLQTPQGKTSNTIQIEEGLPAGTIIGHLTAVDPDPRDKLSFSIQAASQGKPVDIEIISGRLVTSKPLDFETKRFHEIVIRAADQEGKFIEKTARIDVVNVPARIAVGFSRSVQEFGSGGILNFNPPNTFPIAVGDKVSKSLFISNTGDDPLEITGVSLSTGVENSSSGTIKPTPEGAKVDLFSFTGDPIQASNTVPLKLNPGENCQFEIILNTTKRGSCVSTLMIHNNDPDASNFKLILMAQVR